MRILFLHPEDSPLNGPWSGQAWDLIVDLGKSSRFTELDWSQSCGCPVLRSDTFRHGIADAKTAKEVISVGGGRLGDRESIDWWDLLSVRVAFEVLSLLALERMAGELPSAEFWATRDSTPLHMIQTLLGLPIRIFGNNVLQRSAHRARHYAALLRRFSPAQLKEILLDKYDSGYRWRSQWSPRPGKSTNPVILIPSAYSNVSRMAYAYARLFPEHRFLMVATRQNAKQYAAPENVAVRDLAAYARTDDSAESASLVERWQQLRVELQQFPQWRILIAAGVLDSYPGRLRDGLRARNAWRAVLEDEPVQGILCGDDSNVYTRLPVALAKTRQIPSLDFHHGAMDGLYVLKELASDLYLAKNEMEFDYIVRVCGLPEDRVVIGAPAGPQLGKRSELRQKNFAIFFSEPYEVAGMRAEQVYREVLPPLCRVARGSGKTIVLKLHPFESPRQRRRLVRNVLPPAEVSIVQIVHGPLTSDLLAQAWFGITVESTTVVDCLNVGVPCFLCNWLTLSPFGYAEQYGRFGIGEALGTVEELEKIPARLQQNPARPVSRLNLSPALDPEVFQRWLTGPETVAARSVS
jgi:hypothetical protein